MRSYVSRMVQCGIPRITAICIVRYFKRDNRLDDLKEYVRFLEDETDERVV